MFPRPAAMRQERCYLVEGRVKLAERVPSVKLKAPAIITCKRKK